jgi:hypothetical protein
MSTPCNPKLDVIRDGECVTESLEKINNNFLKLETITCSLEEKFRAMKTTRLFFYYGVNTQTVMQDGIASRPSNSTIYNFLNDTNQLNLPAISYTGDVAFVIYQKTGFRTSQPNTENRLPETEYSEVTTDIFNEFAPIFVIWKFTYNGTNYTKANGFPKFTRNLAQGSASFWNNPQLWTTFNSWA